MNAQPQQPLSKAQQRELLALQAELARLKIRSEQLRQQGRNRTGKPIEQLMGRAEVLKTLKPEQFATAQFGAITVKDILAELEKPGRDPRPGFQVARFNEGVNDIADLKEGMVLEGTVSNVAAFGAFVDLGVHQDGLIHVSQLANRFVSDAREIVKTGQIVKVKVLDAYAGPVITRYEIEPDVGVRGSSVTNLEKDLARSLGVTAIRLVETIPGKTCMGLELPNPKRQTIRLREVFDSPAFAASHSKLTLALGEDITGEPVVTDLAKAPHLLVAGTTGSGKSVGVNSMILSMLYKATPEDVRLIMIDPKMLELSVYQDIPHLLAPVVTDMKHAANALNWCVNEMEKRYRLMSHVGVRNLAGYNEKIAEAAARGEKIANPFSFTPNDPEPLEKLPFIVVVVDEFADLMMVAGKQIEQLIARLAQKARAAGIHLILATQRPSVDVITGLIKANIPTRIAFQVSSKIDSRTVLDQMGAENLLGQGDMLFLPPGTGYPQRVHGAFVADEEVHRVVDYLKQFGEPDYVEEILSPEQAEFSFDGSPNSGSSNEKDPLFDQAVEVIVRTQKATISSLQRHLRIGYNKAATIIDQLEAEGIVSAADHSGKRKILARKGDD